MQHPSSPLIPQYFQKGNELLGRTQLDLNRAMFPFNQHLRTNLALKFLQMEFELVLRRLLRPPGLSESVPQRALHFAFVTAIGEWG